jgi:hypothetical protein
VVDFLQIATPVVLAVAEDPALAQPPEREEGAGGERERESERRLMEPWRQVGRGSVRSRDSLFLFTQALALSSEREKHLELKALEAAKPAAFSVLGYRIRRLPIFEPTWIG